VPPAGTLTTGKAGCTTEKEDGRGTTHCGRVGGIPLAKAGFIREVIYTTWLANVVIVKKANGKWRMCVDYTDLNKACPKDTYPYQTLTDWWMGRRDTRC